MGFFDDEPAELTMEERVVKELKNLGYENAEYAQNTLDYYNGRDVIPPADRYKAVSKVLGSVSAKGGRRKQKKTKKSRRIKRRKTNRRR